MRQALSILETGFLSALPCRAIKKTIRGSTIYLGDKKIPLDRYSDIYVIAIGKSSDLMAKVVDSCTRIRGGLIIMPEGSRSLTDAKKFTVVKSSHPIPTRKSLIAAKTVSSFLHSVDKNAFVIFLISGGASSLVCMPDGISLREKQAVNKLLLKSGASIGEINCVRKHLSKIKGGQILESLGCSAVSLVMSDVVGDDLSVIASGLTYCDRSTFSDARKILLKYRLKGKIPSSVWRRIVLGTQRKIPETPKKSKIDNWVISSNWDCVKAMERHARKLRFVTTRIWPIEGDVKKAAAKISKSLATKRNTAIVFGGETTVMVKGKGLGGRNQELVLNLLKKSPRGKPKIIFASAGTDGVDGNTSMAGAIADSTMPSDVDKYLDANNSYLYFKKNGGAIFTGQTHTNLMDIGLVLRK